MRECKDKRKHAWIWGYEDASIKGNTHESEDMSIQGYQQVGMNLRVWGYEDARIQANTHKPGNMT